MWEPNDCAFREGAIRPTWFSKEHTRSVEEAADSVGSADHKKFSQVREVRTRNELFVDGFERSGQDRNQQLILAGDWIRKILDAWIRARFVDYGRTHDGSHRDKSHADEQVRDWT